MTRTYGLTRRDASVLLLGLAAGGHPRLSAPSRPANTRSALRRSSLLKLSNSQIKTWARHAASGDLGATISRESPPTGTGQHSNTDRKGGSFPIMHQQFLRAVGVRAVTGNAALKLSRIYNMYTTCGQRNENRREAAHAAKTQI